jgi:uncharacterized protein GlcG (DUF336 family)
MKHTVLLSLLGMCAMGVSLAGPADLARPLDKPAGPRSLPGDNLPPFNMLDDKGQLIPMPANFGAGMHRGPATEPESKAVGPSLDVAIAGARAAVADCKSRGYLGAATVVDSTGEARAMLTADGADGSHVFVAQRKAITAIGFGMSSAEAQQLVKKDPKAIARVTPNMFVQFGAYLIKSRGQTIGAIGYSGGDDEACAMAGLKVMESQLGK